MKKLKNKLKKNFSILLSVAIVFSHLNVQAIDTQETITSNLEENDTTETISIEEMVETETLNLDTDETLETELAEIESTESKTEYGKFETNEIEENIELESSEILEVINLSEFSDEVSSLTSNDSFETDNTYVSKRLLVTSNVEFDTFGAESALCFGNLYVLTYETESDTKTAYKNLSKSEDIISVEVDSVIETSSLTSPNEILTAETITNETTKINSSVVVAVLDSGIDISNSLFTNRIIDLGINLSSSGEENSIQDDNGHGTAVASVIAKNSNATLLPIKIANNDGKGTVLSLYLAIQTAIENEADIINLSLTTAPNSELLTSIIKEADEKGILVVAAAGNQSANVENYTPANIDSVITVAATDKEHNPASYSNYGELVDYAALGEMEVESLNGTITMTGTSLSAAYVTSVLANTLETGEDFSQFVYSNGENIYFGKGIVSLEEIILNDNSDIEVPKTERQEKNKKNTLEEEQEVNLAAFSGVNSGFGNNDDQTAFVSSDAHQSNYKSIGPYYFTEHRYQAGSRKTGSSTRIFSNTGTYGTNSVGDTTTISLGAHAKDEKLNTIPSATAISGYFPAGTTLTFKIKTISCGHTKDLYCGLKIKSTPSGANSNFAKYNVDTFKTKINSQDGTTYTGSASYKIGTNSWTKASVDWTYNWNGSKYVDRDGDEPGYWTGLDKVYYPSSVNTDVNADTVWIYSRGGGFGGNGSTGAVALTITYECNVTGTYTFDTMGYAEHCSQGGNYVQFNVDSNAFEVNLYELAVNPSGGTWNNSTSTSTFADFEGNTKSISNPTRTNYIFKGWTLSGGGSFSNGTYTYGTSNATLTAQWQPTYSHTLSYNANGGSGAPSSQSVTNTSSTHNMTVSSTIPTRTGYTFAGWNTNSSGTGTNYSAGNSVPVGANTTVTLYAKWTPNTIGVTWNPNNGLIDGTSYPSGVWTTIKFNSSTITQGSANYTRIPDWAKNGRTARTGYTFKGWYDAASGGNQVFDANGNYKTNGSYWNSSGNWNKTSNVTLYAQWTMNTYNVQFNYNGGGAGPVNTAMGYYEGNPHTGHTSTETSSALSYGTEFWLSDPIRTGYTFTGWSISNSDTSTRMFYNGTTSSWESNTNSSVKTSGLGYTGTYKTTGYKQMRATSGTVTFTANWSVNPYLQIIQVRYENADGTFTSYSNVLNENRNYGTTVSWSRAADATYKAASVSYTVTGAKTTQVTVYRNTHTITLNKGTGIASLTGAGTYRYGQSVTINATLSTGYHWVNWTGSTTYTNMSNTFTVNGNKTFTANAAINTSTLKVNPNGGSWNNSTSVQSFTQNYNTTKSIPVPTRTGYTFTGWTRTNTYGTMSSLTSAATYKFGATHNVTDTLTASWKINQYTVTYIDIIDSQTGKELGRTTKQVNYGTNVKGSDIGSDTNDNHYYNGYYYDSCTTATVTTSGATVYRIFKLRTIDISGNINWEDWNNKNESRPSTVILHIIGSDGNTYDYEISGDNSKLTNINSWQYSETLPKYNNNGNVVTYTVNQEKAISQEEGLAYKEPIVNGYNITNIINTTEDVKPEINVTTSIEWIDNNNEHNFRPKTITIQLLQNGVVIDEVTTSDNKYTFKNLYKYDKNGELFYYTVKTNSVDRYDLKVNNTSDLYKKSITYTFQSPIFSVTIPKTVILDGQTGIGEYTISVKGNIDDRDSINVVPDSSFTMKNDFLSDIIATIKQTITSFTNKNGIKDGTTTKGTITTKSLAGEWSGSFNFNIYFEFGK